MLAQEKIGEVLERYKLLTVQLRAQAIDAFPSHEDVDDVDDAMSLVESMLKSLEHLSKTDQYLNNPLITLGVIQVIDNACADALILAQDIIDEKVKSAGK